MGTPANGITTEQKIHNSLEDMHNMASGSLSRIRGIAKCALRALETESGTHDLEAIAEALKSIALDADMSHNDIGYTAEKHGIKTTCSAWVARLRAMPNERTSTVVAVGV